MAIDTKGRRFSILNFAADDLLIHPDNTISGSDRLHLLGLYSGITPFVGVPTVPGMEFTLPDNRLHFAVPVNRMHYTLPDNRLHFAVPEED